MQKFIDLPQGASSLIQGIDFVICDIWGVLHNGETVHKEAVQALENMRATGIQTVFLTNAPKPRQHVRTMLIAMGVPSALCDNIVTSGGLARDEIRQSFKGANLFHIGCADFDRVTLEGLPVAIVNDVAAADVMLATGLSYETVKAHHAELSGALDKGIPLLCANPDRIVHVGENIWICAGAVGEEYEKMGGDVHWFGKPMLQAYEACIDEVGLNIEQVSPHKVLVIGDSLKTDIAGAKTAGYKSLLIAGGIHRDELLPLMGGCHITEQEYSSAMQVDHGIAPDAIMPQLRW